MQCLSSFLLLQISTVLLKAVYLATLSMSAIQANTLAGSARYAAGEDERRLGRTESTSLLQTAVHMARLPLVNALTNAIVDGNVIHEWAVRQRNNGEQNFTIPDAIAACEYVVQELDFSTVKVGVYCFSPSLNSDMVGDTQARA